MWDVLFVVLFGTGDNFYTGTPNHLNGELANKTIQVCHSSLPYQVFRLLASKKPPPQHSSSSKSWQHKKQERATGNPEEV
jgi:predicted alpha/beta-hydrolase family hydrolase